MTTDNSQLNLSLLDFDNFLRDVYTKELRRKIYLNVLEHYIVNQNMSLYVCTNLEWELYHILVNNIGITWDNYTLLQNRALSEKFPEFWQQKPSNTTHNGTWWYADFSSRVYDKDSRINALKEAIKLTY